MTTNQTTHFVSPWKAALVLSLILCITVFYESGRISQTVEGLIANHDVTTEQQAPQGMEQWFVTGSYLFWNGMAAGIKRIEAFKAQIPVIHSVMNREKEILTVFRESPLLFSETAPVPIASQNEDKSASSPEQTIVASITEPGPIPASHEEVIPTQNDRGKATPEIEPQPDSQGKTEVVSKSISEIPDSELLPKEALGFKAPYRFLIIGDSMVQSPLGIKLQHRLKYLSKSWAVRKGIVSTGFVRPDFYDWAVKIKKDIDQFRPNIIVVMLGVNDISALYDREDKKYYAFGSRQMKERYQKNIENFVTEVQKLGLNIFWVGIPITEKEALNKKLKLINELQRKVVQKHRDIYYISIWDLLNENEKAVEYVFDAQNRKRKARALDGIHYTLAGGEQVSDHIYTQIVEAIESNQKKTTVAIGKTGEYSHFSQARQKEVTFRLFIPEGGKDETFPVLYLLHGVNGSYNDWQKHAEKTLCRLSQENRLILVTPDGDRYGWYLDSPRIESGQIESYLINELIPYVDQNFPTNGQRAISGVSMGGYGAVRMMFKHHDLFVAASSLSGILDLDQHASRWRLKQTLGDKKQFPEAWTTHSSVTLAAANFSKIQPGQLFLLVGANDKWALNDNRNFVKQLEALKVPFLYQEKKGSHNWKFWDSKIPQLITWHRAGFDLDRDGFPENTQSGAKLLFTAVQNGYTHLSQKIIKANVDVNSRDERGRTPLIKAGIRGDVGLVKQLVDHGAELDVVDHQKRSALFHAASLGKIAVVRFLVEQGADSNLKNDLGQSPLMKAIYHYRTKTAEYLINHGAEINDHDEDGWTPLMRASQRNLVKPATLMLEKGANVEAKDQNGWNALMVASLRGNVRLANLLLQNGADIEATDKKRRTPLMAASWKGKSAMVNFLLESGASIDAVDKKGENALFKAAKYGQRHIVSRLLDWGADIDSRDRSGNTPLMVVSTAGVKKTARFLIEHGADVSLTGRNGWTALHWATSTGKTEIVKILIDGNADVNAPAKNGKSALSYAAGYSYLEIATNLLDASADVDHTDNSGYTPLFWAVKNGHEDMAALLLERNAGIDVKNNREESIDEIAQTLDNEKINRLMATKRLDRQADEYYRKGDIHEALNAYNLLLAEEEELQVRFSDLTTLKAIADCHIRLHQPQKALDFLNRALTIHMNTNQDTSTVAIIRKIGRVHYSLGNFTSAVNYLVSAHILSQELSQGKKQSTTESVDPHKTNGLIALNLGSDSSSNDSKPGNQREHIALNGGKAANDGVSNSIQIDMLQETLTEDQTILIYPTHYDDSVMLLIVTKDQIFVKGSQENRFEAVNKSRLKHFDDLLNREQLQFQHQQLGPAKSVEHFCREMMLQYYKNTAIEPVVENTNSSKTLGTILLKYSSLLPQNPSENDLL